jgi:hypothetical protein
MKLAIYTQYRENYGSALAPYWKNKGGDTYVVQCITEAQADRIRKDGIPTLKSLIEFNNPMSTEHIISYEVMQDSEVVGEEWETLTNLSYLNGRWTATRVTENDEFGYMRAEIKKKIESWDVVSGCDRENYTCSYVLASGKVVKSCDINAEFA